MRVRATLRDTAAGKADLTRCRFDGTDLQGSTLRGARLTGASFAQLEGVDLRDAELEGAKLGANARGIVEVDPARG